MTGRGGGEEKQKYTGAILWLRTRARSKILGVLDRGGREATLTLDCLAHYIPLAHGVRSQLAIVLQFADLNRINGHLCQAWDGWGGVMEVVERDWVKESKVKN